MQKAQATASDINEERPFDTKALLISYLRNAILILGFEEIFKAAKSLTRRAKWCRLLGIREEYALSGRGAPYVQCK